MYKDASLDKLRCLAVVHAQNNRLNAEIRLHLDQIYKRYQRDLYTFSLTNKLHPSPVLRYVGNKTCVRGLTVYNNFCLYDPEASLIHHDCKCPIILSFKPFFALLTFTECNHQFDPFQTQGL
jgi:hypothetical protein